MRFRKYILPMSIILLLTLALIVLASACRAEEPKPLDFFEAAEQGNVARMKELLAADPTLVNKVSANGWEVTALHLAASGGWTDAVKFLLAQGADHERRERSGRTPLVRALAWRRWETARVLLDSGADANAPRTLSETVFWDNREMIQLLLARGADVNARGRGGCLPIHDALRDGNSALAQLFLEKGSTLDVFSASGLGLTDRVEAYLKENPARLNARLNDWMPLHWAARNGQAATVKFLVEKGADVNAVWGYGFNALHCAAMADSGEAVAYLVGKGLNVKQTTGRGRQTPLHLAAESGSPAVIAALIDAGADLSAADRRGLAPLHCAVRGNFVAQARGASGNLEAVKALIEKGADVNIRSKQAEDFLEHDPRAGFTPLHVAVQVKRLDLVTFLVEHKADVNAEDGSGRAPLADAEGEGLAPIADFLKKHGGTVGHPRPIKHLP